MEAPKQPVERKTLDERFRPFLSEPDAAPFEIRRIREDLAEQQLDRPHVAGNSLGGRVALEAGVDVLTSLVLSEDTVPLLAQRQIPCNISPISPSTLQFLKRHRNPDYFDFVKRQDDFHRALSEAQATLLFGTQGAVYDEDRWNDWKEFWPVDEEKALQLGEALFVSLRAAEYQGVKPMDALMAVTRNVAQAFKVDKELGTLEAGKRSDLVILDRNPLQSAEHYRSIALVMKDGRVIDRDALPTRRLLTADASRGS